MAQLRLSQAIIRPGRSVPHVQYWYNVFVDGAVLINVDIDVDVE
jgi:hypothetical protein